MQLSLNTFSLALFISAIVSAVVGFFTYQRRQVHGALTLFWIFVGLSFWSLGYGVEMLNPGLAWHKFWTVVPFISIPFIPVLWLLFAIQYTRQYKAPSFKKLIFLFIVPISAVLMAWTNEFHHLFWSSMQLVKLNNINMMAVEFGPYFIFYAIYSYIAIFSGIFLFLRHAFTAGPSYRSQAYIMLAAVMAFITGNGLYLLGLLPFRGLDITPFSFTLSGLIISYGLFRYQFLDLMPIANEIILQNIGDGVLVIDNQKRVLFINPAFEQMAGLLSGSSVGSQVQDVFFNWPDIFYHTQTPQSVETQIMLGDSNRYLQVQISPIWHRERFQGSIYLIHDITERASREEKMRMFIESRDKVSEDFIFIAVDKTNSAILDVNGSFSLATGYTPEEVIGKSLLSLNFITVETRALLNRLLHTSPGIQDMGITVRAKNGLEQEWNVSINNISIRETSYKIWMGQLIKS